MYTYRVVITSDVSTQSLTSLPISCFADDSTNAALNKLANFWPFSPGTFILPSKSVLFPTMHNAVTICINAGKY